MAETRFPFEPAAAPWIGQGRGPCAPLRGLVEVVRPHADLTQRHGAPSSRAKSKRAGHLAKLGRLLPGDKLECSHGLSSSVADPVDVDHDMPRSAEYLVVPVRRRIGYEPRVLYLANEFADSNLSLQPRERAAETDVDTAAVAEVLVVLAFEVDLVWVREAVWVAVARSIQHNDRRALWNGRSRNPDVFEGGAGGPELDRRFETQELLDPRHDELGPAAQLLEGLAVPQQGEHAMGDQVDSRLMAGKEQKRRVAHELARRQALF